MSLFQTKYPQIEKIPANALYFRTLAGMNRSDVTRKVGVDQSALAKLEKGKMKNPTIATLLALTIAYDCTLDDLVYREPTAEDIIRTR